LEMASVVPTQAKTRLEWATRHVVTLRKAAKGGATEIRDRVGQPPPSSSTLVRCVAGLAQCIRVGGPASGLSEREGEVVVVTEATCSLR
jgi:hypothetical protein